MWKHGITLSFLLEVLSQLLLPLLSAQAASSDVILKICPMIYRKLIQRQSETCKKAAKSQMRITKPLIATQKPLDDPIQ